MTDTIKEIRTIDALYIYAGNLERHVDELAALNEAQAAEIVRLISIVRPLVNWYDADTKEQEGNAWSEMINSLKSYMVGRAK